MALSWVGPVLVLESGWEGPLAFGSLQSRRTLETHLLHFWATPQVFNRALGFQQLSLVSLTLQTSPSLLTSPPSSHQPQGLLCFLPTHPCLLLLTSLVFSKRYLISVRVGPASMQYALSLSLCLLERRRAPRGILGNWVSGQLMSGN